MLFHANLAASFHTDPTALLDPTVLFASNSAPFLHADATAPLLSDSPAFFDADALTATRFTSAHAPAVPTRRPAPAISNTQPIAAAVKARSAPAVIVPAVLTPRETVLDVIDDGLFLGGGTNPFGRNRRRFSHSNRQTHQHGCRQHH
jgi:hypothetical protein